MFRLHETARRRVCIAGFFALCVAPTIAVAAWCAVRNRPGYVEAEARRLGRELGVRVSLDGLRHLRPGAVLYEGLELADPETGNLLLRCRLLETTRSKAVNSQGNPVDSLMLCPSQPEIQADALARLGRLLRRVLQSETPQQNVNVRISAAEMTLHSGKNSQTLTHCRGAVETLPGGSQAQLALRIAGMDTPRPVRIRLDRNRQADPPASAVELDTGGGALPCSLLAMALPELHALGPRCRFRGYLSAQQSPGGQSPEQWDGEASGQLLDVDLDRLVSDRLAHKLSGTADVTIQSARFCRGRLQEASGTLAAGPGVISRSLIDAAVSQLGLVPNTPPEMPHDLIAYQQLALAAILDADGLRLQGRCASPQYGTILTDRRGAVLVEPKLRRQPVIGLIRTLVPQNELQVPATRQTDWLIRRLPVPQIVRRPAAEPAAPRARVRFGEKAARTNPVRLDCCTCWCEGQVGR